MEWCNSGELLAVAGQRLDGDSTPGVFTNMVHFYTSQGELRYTSQLPCTTASAHQLCHAKLNINVKLITVNFNCKATFIVNIREHVGVHVCTGLEK